MCKPSSMAIRGGRALACHPMLLFAKKVLFPIFKLLEQSHFRIFFIWTSFSIICITCFPLKMIYLFSTVGGLSGFHVGIFFGSLSIMSLLIQLRRKQPSHLLKEQATKTVSVVLDLGSTLESHGKLFKIPMIQKWHTYNSIYMTFLKGGGRGYRDKEQIRGSQGLSLGVEVGGLTSKNEPGQFGRC